MKKWIALAALVIVGSVSAAPAMRWYERKQQIAEQQNVHVPKVTVMIESSSSSSVMSSAKSVVASSAQAAPTPTPNPPVAPPPAASLKAEVNMGVPFTPQAPTGNWDPPFDEACEEASALMVVRYFQGKGFASTEDADAAIRAMAQANADLGYPIDTTAEEVVTLLKSVAPSLNSRTLKNPTVEQLKQNLSDGALIIVPAAGRQLGNPYFQNPGPLYHMLVLRGYTKDGYFITNDPGTKRGEQYVYRFDKIMSAMHDWNGGDVDNGQKIVIVVSK